MAKTDLQKDAKKTQKIDNGIDAQTRVLKVPTQKWSKIRQLGLQRRFLSEKEAGIIRIAEQIPQKIPTEKQREVLIAVLEKAEFEGVL